ncbi:MAG: hypothetical protein AB7S99_00300 [Pseudodonghicola sp.]
MAHSTAPTAIFAPLPNPFSALSKLFRGDAGASALTRQVIEISKLSDTELADRDLRRGDIARFVMHDSYWT